MRNYLTSLLVAGFIIVGSIFAFPKNAKSLDSIVENSTGQKIENVAVSANKPIVPISTEQKTENSQVEKSKLKGLKLDGGGNFNEVSNQGYFGSEVKLNNNLELGLSYERVDGKNLNAKNKEKSLLIASIEYKNWRNTVFGISYNSDKNLGIYSTFRGGFKKQVSKTLYVEGFMGLKIGRINFSLEKEDVFGGMLRYQKDYAKNKVALNLQLSGHMPRKYIRKDITKSPWTGEAIISLTSPVTKDVSIGGEYKINHDYLLGLGAIERKGFSIKCIYNMNQKGNKN